VKKWTYTDTACLCRVRLPVPMPAKNDIGVWSILKQCVGKVSSKRISTTPRHRSVCRLNIRHAHISFPKCVQQNVRNRQIIGNWCYQFTLNCIVSLTRLYWINVSYWLETVSGVTEIIRQMDEASAIKLLLHAAFMTGCSAHRRWYGIVVTAFLSRVLD